MYSIIETEYGNDVLTQYILYFILSPEIKRSFLFRKRFSGFRRVFVSGRGREALRVLRK